MIHFLLLMNRQGKVRLSKWYAPFSMKDKKRMEKDLGNTIVNRRPKECNFIEWKEQRIVYRRYASLYFIVCVDKNDNELLALEVIHLYCVTLDKYFGNVCELDIIFNFDKAYQILDEFLIGGEIQDTSALQMLSSLAKQDEQIMAEIMEETGLLN